MSGRAAIGYHQRKAVIAWGLALMLLLSACGSLPEGGSPFGRGDSAPSNPIDVSQVPDAVPRLEERSKYGNPPSYTVNRQRYYVLDDHRGYVERGIASWYGTKFHGRPTSSGEPYDMYAMTAAHRSLPLPTYAAVTNLSNGKSVIVKINDRGPFMENRIIDLSYAAAEKLGITPTGTGLVEIRAIDPTTYRVESPAAPPATVPPHRVDLFLQLGAFSERSNAERLLNRLQAIPPQQVHIVPTEFSGSTLYRVRVGPLASVEEADRLSRQIEELGVGVPQIVID
jgi:rare lipoprotein A